MSAAVFSIGTELTRGELVNTNAHWLSAELIALGHEVTEHATVDDDDPRMIAALERLSRDHDVVVCTGGLGPTTDDRTTAVVAKTLGVAMVKDEPSLEAIRARFAKAGRTMSPTNEKQAFFPAGAEILPNPVGTAPGFAVTLGRALFFFMPGVPREMKRIFADSIAERLRASAPATTHQIRLQTFGMPESLVGERLAGVEADHPGVTIGYRAHFPEIEVKVLARGASREEARAIATKATAVVKERLAAVLYAEGPSSFPVAVAALLQEKKLSLAFAESCTGGLAGSLVTGVPGSSRFFLGSLVTYSNALKESLLGVPRATIEAHGAVSEETARAMAEGAREKTGADIAVAITGIAGPDGGTETKPVGTVYFAVATASGTRVVRRQIAFGDRVQIQTMAAFAALAGARDACLPDREPVLV